MDVLIDFAKILVPAAIGSGATWWFNLRATIRRGGNKIREEDFDTVRNVVKGAMVDLKELSARIGELETDKVKILEQMSALQEEKTALQDRIKNLERENRKLEDAVRVYIRSRNPDMK